MAFEIEWLEGAQNELDAEIAFVLNEFGFKAAQKAYLRIQVVIDPFGLIITQRKVIKGRCVFAERDKIKTVLRRVAFGFAALFAEYYDGTSERDRVTPPAWRPIPVISGMIVPFH